MSVFLVDMDGVIVRGSKPIAGAKEAVTKLRKCGRVVLLTNNAIRDELSLWERLKKMGFDFDVSDIFSSITALREYLREHPKIQTVYPAASMGVMQAIVEEGRRIKDDLDVDAVVVSFDYYVTYRKLERATKAILKGAKFIATNTDPFIVTEDGLARPGAGAIVSAVETATGVRPIVLGKPSENMYLLASKYYGFDLSEAYMIGDRIETDIVGALKVGVRGVLVLTGATSKVESVPSGVEVYSSIFDFAKHICP